MNDPLEQYWAIDAPGLSESQANVLTAQAAEMNGVVGPSAVDPAVFLTVSLDHASVLGIARALHAASSAGVIDDETRSLLGSIPEVFDEWLKRSAEVNPQG